MHLPKECCRPTYRIRWREQRGGARLYAYAEAGAFFLIGSRTGASSTPPPPPRDLLQRHGLHRSLKFCDKNVEAHTLLGTCPFLMWRSFAVRWLYLCALYDHIFFRSSRTPRRRGAAGTGAGGGAASPFQKSDTRSRPGRPSSSSGGGGGAAASGGFGGGGDGMKTPARGSGVARSPKVCAVVCDSV